VSLQCFVKQGLKDGDLVPDSFGSAACLLYILGKIHGFGLFDKFPYGCLPVVFTFSQAAAEVYKMARLSTAKGGLEQKVDFAAVYSKGYDTSAHFPSLCAIANI